MAMNKYDCPECETKESVVLLYEENGVEHWVCEVCGYKWLRSFDQPDSDDPNFQAGLTDAATLFLPEDDDIPF